MSDCSLPLVSVIVTTYNRESLLPRAINSVLSQTYKNIETIIVDDCSTDNTAKIIKDIGSDKLIYIKNEKNIGLAASRNVGIRYSKGEFISFLDDDDEILSTKIEKQVNLLANNDDVGVVYCGSLRLYKNHKLHSPAKYRGNILKHVLKYPLNVIHSLIIRRSCILEVGMFDENLFYYEDWDLWVKLAMRYNFDYVDECLAIYNMHEEQMTFDLDKRIEHHIILLKKYYDKISSHSGLVHWHYRKLLSRCLLAGRYDDAFDYILKSIKSNPLDLASYIHFLLFFVSKKLQKQLILKLGTTRIGGVYIP